MHRLVWANPTGPFHSNATAINRRGCTMEAGIVWSQTSMLHQGSQRQHPRWAAGSQHVDCTGACCRSMVFWSANARSAAFLRKLWHWHADACRAAEARRCVILTCCLRMAGSTGGRWASPGDGGPKDGRQAFICCQDWSLFDHMSLHGLKSRKRNVTPQGHAAACSEPRSCSRAVWRKHTGHCRGGGRRRALGFTESAHEPEGGVRQRLGPRRHHHQGTILSIPENGTTINCRL